MPGAMSTSAVDFETNPNSPGWKSLRSTLNEVNGMAGTQPGLIDGLVIAVSRLSTAEAARVCGQTPSLLSSRLDREPNTALRNELALSLAKVAGEHGPVDASRVCDDAIGSRLEHEPTARVRLDRPACREVTTANRSPDRKQAGAVICPW